MGSGSTKVMRQSEWIKVRARTDTLQMIDQCVTQTLSEKGLYCGEGGEEFLKRERVDLEVYLEDLPDFVENHLKDFTLKRPHAQPYDFRPYAAYQLARLLWLSSLVDVELEGRFLLGLRDRHTPIIQLLSEDVKDPKERKVLQEMDIRVNIVGDKAIHRLLFEDEKAKQELVPKCSFAESLLDADLLEARQAKNPTTEFLDGDGNKLFRKKRVNDLPNAPSLSEFQAGDLQILIRAYYDALYRSALWKRYKELLGEPIEEKMEEPAVEEKNPKEDSGIYKESPQLRSLVPLWPVEKENYDYNSMSYMYPGPAETTQAANMWAIPGGGYGSPAMMQTALQPYGQQDQALPIDYNVPPEYLRPSMQPAGSSPESLGPDMARTQGNHNSYAGPMYQMYLPNQYAY